MQQTTQAIEQFKLDQISVAGFLWEMARLAKPSDAQLQSVTVSSESEKTSILIAKLTGGSQLDEFMSIGSDLTSPRFGLRYVKHSPSVEIGGLKGKYWDEWSVATNKPHGKGLFFNLNGSI